MTWAAIMPPSPPGSCAAFLGFDWLSFHRQQDQRYPDQIGQQQVRDLHPNRRQQKQVDRAGAKLR